MVFRNTGSFQPPEEGWACVGSARPAEPRLDERRELGEASAPRQRQRVAAVPAPAEGGVGAAAVYFVHTRGEIGQTGNLGRLGALSLSEFLFERIVEKYEQQIKLI